MNLAQNAANLAATCLRVTNGSGEGSTAASGLLLWHDPAMTDFQLVTDSDGSTTHFHDDSQYVVHDSGVLVIISEGVRWTYGSGAWLSVQDLVGEVPTYEAPRFT